MRGGVFICYRREIRLASQAEIYDRLKTSLGRESVFIDVDNIPAGLDFVDVLSERVGQCGALIAVIGRNWVASADKNNGRRLDDANDYVRIEIEAALTRNVPVIPVLIDGAAMPHTDDLPNGLKKLARRQGIEISHTSFNSDAARLTDALARIDGDAPGSPSAADAAAARSSAPPPRPAASRPRRLFLAASALIVIAGGAGFLYWPQQAQQETAAPADAAAPPSDTANNVAAPAPNAAPDETPTGKIADSAPAGIGKAVTPEQPTAAQQWMNFEDFRVEYDRQVARNSYPDKVWGRCWNGVPQRAVAHWSPRPPGQYISLNHTVETGSSSSRTGEKDFKSDGADMAANGFKMKSDSIFQGCDGFTRHLTVWMKGE